MSGLFGGSGARREAEQQAARARRERQASNEEAGRAQQQAERGVGGGRGRNMLVGNLTNPLKRTLGG